MDYDQEEENGTFTLRIKSRSDEHEGTQKKTFTKWINAQLAKSGAGQQVKDLFEDLKDGTKLLLLLEVLCGKRIRSEKGQTRVHFMTNVDNALRILEQNNVRPVNISNDDIVDGNPKLTLGLMWYIISHFQLQLLLKNLMLDSDSETPEEKLLAWCRQSVRGYDAVEVRNFTTSWRDGLAFNALIHRYRPHLFDYSDQLEKKPVECCEHAFTVAEQYLDVERLLDPEDVVRDRPDKKSILMYVSNLYNKLAPGVSHLIVQRNGSRTVEKSEHTHTVSTKRTTSSTYHTEHTVKHVKKGYDDREPVRYVTTTSTTVKEPPIQHSAVTTVVERSLEAERPDSFVSETSSVRDSVGSFKEWEDYNTTLHEVLNWLSQAERTLESQERISDNVDAVKKQFHGHEDFMMELTSHQSEVGAVLEFGNQMISEGLVNDKEESEIREQMISLNDRWEGLRMAAMDRQTKLHVQLMDLQQKQIDELADWLTVAEQRISSSEVIGSDLDTVRHQVEDHKFFQEDLEKQQQQVNSLTHMVVVVDDGSNESATADLEEQLAVLGERWSNVCKWAEQRWTMLQDVLKSWQEYREEERRLSKWLAEKEAQIEEMKHIDLGDIEVVRKALKMVIGMEQEMEAQQATFGTFNLAAEKVAENLDENSPGVADIQDKMEEFNERWNKITTDVSGRITLFEGMEMKLQHLHNDLADKNQWMTDTETLLKSPTFNLEDENISSEKVQQQSELVESLDNARRQRKPSVTSVQKKAEELIEHCRNQGNIPVSLEQTLSSFTDRWNAVGALIDGRRHKAQLARRRREVQDLMSTLEAVSKDVERVVTKFTADVPGNEYEIKSQLELCKLKLDELLTNEVSLIKVRELSRSLSKEDRHTPHLQAGVKRIDDRWSKAQSTLEDRQKQLTAALESGPPKQFLSTMDAVLLKIKNMESQLGSEFLISDTASLEEQLKKFKQLQVSMAEQQKNMDYLNSTGDKFVKSLPRQRSEQLRTKLADLNDKWRDINLHAEKRQNQVGKAVNQTRQFTEEMRSLFKWMNEANDFLKDQEPAAGDPETMEAQLEQSEVSWVIHLASHRSTVPKSYQHLISTYHTHVLSSTDQALQGDVTKLQRKLDSLNETGPYMISKATPAFAEKLRKDLDELNSRWEELVRVALRVKDNLLASLEKYQKLNKDMKDISHWIMQIERSIADYDGDITSDGDAQEKVDYYKTLQQDISKRAPVVVRINTTAKQMVENTKQGSPAALQESLKKMNSDWDRLKTKVAQRQREFKQTQLEVEQLNALIERDYKLMGEVDRVVEKSYHVLEGTEAELEDALRSMNRHVSNIRESGKGSVRDLARQLTSKRISVRKQMEPYEERVSDIRGKVDKTRQVLEGEIQRRQQLKKDLDTIRVWVVKIEVLINSKLAKHEEMDESAMKALEDEFAMNKSLMDSVESTCHELSQTPKGSVYLKMEKELEQVRAKWEIIRTRFSKLKEQPGKKLESDFDTLHGQTLTVLDKIQRGVKKLKLESSEPRNIQSLLDKCVSYKDELASIKKDLDQVRRLGHQITEKVPEEKRSGVEKRVEEVFHEHRELDKKLLNKEEAFREALPLAERLERDMSNLENWLEDKTSEVKRREEAGFPEDVDAEIKWNKGLVQEVTGKMSDVQQLTQVGRELVDLSETGQLENLEDRLTRINIAWEDLSSAAEQRMLTLPKYKAKLADFEKSVDQMNHWLEDMEKETHKVRPKDEETGVAKNKIDEIQESIRNREPQLNLIRKQSDEFVSHGKQIMEPYKRLLDRRWDDLAARIGELEKELEDAKRQAEQGRAMGGRVETEIIVKERKTLSSQPDGWIEEYLREETETDAGRPVIETITTHRTYTTHTKPETGYIEDEDFQRRMKQILLEVQTLEDRIVEIQTPKKSTENEVNEIIKGLKPEEIEEQQAKYEMVFKNIEELDRQGVQILSAKEIERLRKRFKDVHTKFTQYQRPSGDATSYRITVHTGDVKDAGTQSNVSIMLFGEKGNSPKLRLEKSETYNTKFCRDQLDIFTFYNIPQLGDLHKVQIWHDMTGPKHEWFVKGFYVEDKSTRKVYFFNCNAWIGRDDDEQDIKCEGYTLPEEGEDIMNKSSLARIRWQVTLADHQGAQSPGWKVVEDFRKLSDEVHEVELQLESPELQKADFEDFSKQEDKLKLIGEKIEDLDARALEILSRSETVQSACSEKEYEAVKRAASKFRLQWNNLNQDYKARSLRWEKAVTVWRQFHCDLKDVTSWMTHAEKVLEATSGENEFSAAKKEQKGLEESVGRHQSTVNAMNLAGQEIISKSTTVEADMLRDKLATQNRRWEFICSQVTERRDRYTIGSRVNSFARPKAANRLRMMQKI
ncbi:Dystrophin [Acropora cervicornis]|uniref:Dystrophin n=1 Tax=Acropora cervicornis TaxID=6130 RepID=A0AAD9QZW7_ACRCE|nr:Dystrophin [Acropora cervicornis]